jgi:hypothetical protein
MGWIGRGAPGLAWAWPSSRLSNGERSWAPVDQGLRWTFGLMSLVCDFGANATVWTMLVLAIRQCLDEAVRHFRFRQGRLVRIETQINNSLAVRRLATQRLRPPSRA